MSSSISSSKRRSSSTAISGWAAGSLALCVVAGELLWHSGLELDAWHGELPTSSHPEETDFILQEAYTGHSNAYYAQYYGLGPSIGNARQADILLLGNSRVEFAFRAASVREFVRRTGKRVFSLAYGAGDGLKLAQLTLQKHGVFPPVVVVADNFFFGGGGDYLSSYGRKTVEAGTWQARVRMAEHRVSFAVRSVWHQLVPRWALGSARRAVPMITHRSVRDGTQLLVSFPEQRFPLEMKDRSDDIADPGLRFTAEFRSQKNATRRFRDLLAAHGSRMVLTVVPSDSDSYVATRTIASDLDIPFVAVDLDGLETIDHSHLTEQSAHRWATAFFEQLEGVLAEAPPE